MNKLFKGINLRIDNMTQKLSINPRNTGRFESYPHINSREENHVINKIKNSMDRLKDQVLLKEGVIGAFKDTKNVSEREVKKIRRSRKTCWINRED